jgi:heme exporter protein A
VSEAALLLLLDKVACVRGGRVLFEELDLTLEPGGAALVTGPNGAGKSSLLRLAAGLLRASAGTVRRAEGPLGFADEGLALDHRLQLGKALDFWARLDGGRPGPAMAAMGLDGLSDVPVRMLSAGQRKRAVLARAMASGARLWVLDEPANGLDSEGLDRLTEAMTGHRAQGGAILAASHVPLGLHGAQRIAL